MSSQSSSSGSSPRKVSSWILTTAGALLVAGILVALNVISGLSSARLDFTANKVHTLTEGTRNILKRIDSGVAFKLFVSPMDDLDATLRPTVADVEGWLTRYREMRPDVISVQKYEVEPASDEEQAAARAGVEPRHGMYFGIGITCADRDAVIPWVPDYMPPAGVGEERIEYALSAAITEVTRTKKKTVGLMSPLSLSGNQNPFGGGGTPPWALYEVLREQYEVKTLDVKASSIDDDIDVLVLVHPAGITDEAQWAIDQYVLRGGRVVAFLDSYSLVAAQSAGARNPMMGGAPDVIPTSSNLSRLLGAWGYEFNASEIVADMNFQTQFPQLRTGSPVLLTLGQEAINKDDAITEGLSDFWFIYSGAFTGSPASGLEETRFLTTSRNNQMVSTSYANFQPNTPDGMMQLQRLNRSFTPSGTEKLLAFRLTGKFRTAFPEGRPSPPPPDDDDGPGSRGPEGEEGAAAPEGEAAEPAAVPADALPQLPTPAPPATDGSGDAAGEDKPSESSGTQPAEPAAGDAKTEDAGADEKKPEDGAKDDSGSLKEATAEGVVYLVADSDMLVDFLSPMIARNSNIPLALNMIDQAAGDHDLMAVRSRGSSRRPFSYLNRIQEEANAKIRQDIASMQAELDKINAEINSKKTAKERNEAIFAGLREFEQKRRELNGMIYEKQKSANKEVNARKDLIKWVNILLMPVVVTLVGIAVWLLRRTKTSAR